MQSRAGAVDSARAHGSELNIPTSRLASPLPQDAAVRVAALTLADLAGSEKQRKTGTEGQRAKEVRSGADREIAPDMMSCSFPG